MNRSKHFQWPLTNAIFEHIVWKMLYHGEKNYTSTGNSCPYNHFWRIEWLWNAHIKIFSSPNLQILLLDEAIEMEMCFIWKLYTVHINIATINHFQQIIRKLLHYSLWMRSEEVAVFEYCMGTSQALLHYYMCRLFAQMTCGYNFPDWFSRRVGKCFLTVQLILQ